MLATDIAPLQPLLDELRNHPVNSHPFFEAFLKDRLTPRQLRLFTKQYHYFCLHFVKALEGLLYRTPVQELDMRIELAKTLYSELGSGNLHQAHIGYLQRFARSIGLQPMDWEETDPLPFVRTYLHTLQDMFLESDYLVALGAELAVEMTAVSEFRYFYPGLKKYKEFDSRHLEFFELHLKEEQCHGAWLVQAVTRTARTASDFDRIMDGARRTAAAWMQFWNGMHQAVFESTPTAGGPLHA